MAWRESPKKVRIHRFPMMLTDEELAAIDGYRFRNRLETRAKAVRALVVAGLAAEPIVEKPRMRVKAGRAA